VVESQLPKLLVAGSIPVSRSKSFIPLQTSVAGVQHKALAMIFAPEDQQQCESGDDN
jgi:hypothetical protein